MISEIQSRTVPEFMRELLGEIPLGYSTLLAVVYFEKATAE